MSATGMPASPSTARGSPATRPARITGTSSPSGRARTRAAAVQPRRHRGGRRGAHPAGPRPRQRLGWRSRQKDRPDERDGPQRDRTGPGADRASGAAGRRLRQFRLGHDHPRGRGGRVWDVSGNEYIDYLLGSGPMFVGHAPSGGDRRGPARRSPRGTTFFANNEPASGWPRRSSQRVPCAEQIRFVSTGSEADDLRAARRPRLPPRDSILKFEGGYHGMHD